MSGRYHLKIANPNYKVVSSEQFEHHNRTFTYSKEAKKKYYLEVILKLKIEILTLDSK